MLRFLLCRNTLGTKPFTQAEDSQAAPKAPVLGSVSEQGPNKIVPKPLSQPKALSGEMESFVVQTMIFPSALGVGAIPGAQMQM